MHKDDCKFHDQYPVSVYKSRERKPTCRVCQNYLAKCGNCCHIFAFVNLPKLLYSTIWQQRFFSSVLVILAFASVTVIYQF